MRAGHRDRFAKAHELAEHFGARHDRHAARLRGLHLRVIARDCARDHDDIGPIGVSSLVADADFGAQCREPFGDRIGLQIRALYAIAEIDQHFGDTAHAAAADADEVNGLDAPHARAAGH